MAEEKSADRARGVAVVEFDRIFDEDEFQLLQVDPNWEEEELLQKQGIFFLKDVAQTLDIHTNELKRVARQLESENKEPWEIMGIRKTWTHWQVRMKVFAPYYLRNRKPKICSVDPRWDANMLLAQSGRFLLTQVCEKIPFTTHQIRYQVRRASDPRGQFGVWKDDQHKAYLVEMAIFSRWMKAIWLHGKFRETHH